MVSERKLPEDLGPILRHLEAAYPNEGCGVLLRNPASGRWRVQPMRNAYDDYRARDPAGYPRTSRTAYVFDSREQLRVWEMAEAAGERVACVFHSHTDAGAYFSKEDRAMAAPNGEPLYPGMLYLVVAVDRGKATAAKLFWWNGAGFSERPVPLTE
jgi:[CysO sulfur-carrier protein]-S-L-cysteine hydrolase